MRISHRYIGACLLALAFISNAPADDTQARIDLLTARIGRTLATMSVELALYDQVNRIAVAQGRMTPAAADAALRQRAAADSARVLSNADIQALQPGHRQAVQDWASSIGRAVPKAVWPKGGAPAFEPMAADNLRVAADSYAQLMAGGHDPLPALETYAKVAAWTRGQTTLTDANNPFAGQRQRIAAAMPSARARGLMAATLGIGLPPGVKLPPTPSKPTPPPVVDTGRRPPPIRVEQPAPPDMTGLEVDVNRYGGDYRDFDLAQPDPRECRRACLADPAHCRAFTYVKPGRQFQNAHCWLKREVPPPTRHDCCISGLGAAAPATPVRPPGGMLPPEPWARAALGYAWTGLDADVVGAGRNANPDGYVDGHWRATVQLDSAREVAYVAIKSCDARGQVMAPHHWNSRDSGYWLLAVYANGKRLNGGHAPGLGTWLDTVYLDLYGANSGGWLGQPGHTLLEIGLANGQVFTAHTAHGPVYIR